MSRFLLATPEQGFEARVRQAFGGRLNGELSGLSFGAATIDPGTVLTALPHAADGPEVMVLGPGLPVREALAIAQALDQERPEISVVVVAHPSPTLWQEALRAGVREILAPNATDDQLREALQRASHVAQQRRAKILPPAEDAVAAARVITVISPKGGVGKTTVATNLAVAIAACDPRAVVLVDADLQFGDAAEVLGLSPEQTIADAAAAVGGLDAMGLKVFLSHHGDELFALCAPNDPVAGERVTVDAFDQLLRLLGSDFRFVVVDTPAGLTEHTLTALEHATDIVAVCGMDVPSVHSLRKELEVLDQLGLSRTRRHLVLNRANSRVGMGIQDIEETLGLAVDVEVPSSRAVPLSVNQGIPIVSGEPRSPVAQGLQQLADRFVEKAVEERPSRLFRRSA